MVSRSQLSPFGAETIPASSANDLFAADSDTNDQQISLSAQLRLSTRTIHAYTEATFELDQWLVDRTTYAALLTRLWGFHSAAESGLDLIQGWDGLTPGIVLAARHRAWRIEQDLADLGWPRPTPVVGTPTDPLRMTSLADGLGCLYVIEGSAIGGRVIAARARAALGPDLATAFFADPARNTGQDWNALRAALDAFGAGAGAAARRSVIDAAHRTFGAFATVVVREGP